MKTALPQRRSFLLAAGILTSLGCGDPAPKPPNVIFVLVDTLRADHVGTYGYARNTTPFLDQLAEEAVVFERARSQSACTSPSVNSMMTSQYPFLFYSRETGIGIPDDLPTLAQILAHNGYHTAAVTASNVVVKEPNEINPYGGFGAGFDIFDEECRMRHAGCVNRLALRIIKKLDEPYFIYLHYRDPHARYWPPPTKHEHQFTGAYDKHDFIARGDFRPVEAMIFHQGPKVDFTDADLQHLIDLYDEEILFFDSQLAKLVATLRKSGALDRSLLVITADHGEEFMEHGQVGHCRGVWDTLTWVPLMLRGPGLPAGRRISTAVQLIDLVPTIADLLDIPVTEYDLQGVSLRPLITGQDSETRYAFSDQGRYRSVDDGSVQIILNAFEDSLTLYNLADDPHQQTDLCTSNHPDLKRLSGELNNWLVRTGQQARFKEALAAAKRREEELRALGYLQ